MIGINDVNKLFYIFYIFYMIYVDLILFIIDYNVELIITD